MTLHKQLQVVIKDGTPRIIWPGEPVYQSGKTYKIQVSDNNKSCRIKDSTGLVNIFLNKNRVPIELRPSYRTIKVKLDSEIKRYRLAFPYMQFFSVDTKSRDRATPGVTWSFKSISSWDDEVLVPRLPNVDPSSYICLGGDCPSDNVSMCNIFWSTYFYPYDMLGNYRYIGRTILKSLENWEQMSKKSKHPLEVFEHFDAECSKSLLCFILKLGGASLYDGYL